MWTREQRPGGTQASNQGMGRPDLGVEVVIDSTKDAGGPLKPPNLSDLASLSVRSPKAAISLNGQQQGRVPHQPRPR